MHIAPHSLLFKLLIALATGLLIAGLIIPMMSLKQFYFFENSFSVLGGIHQLVLDGKYLLAILIALFSVIVPFIKLGLLFQLSRAQEQLHLGKLLKLMHDYGRWAMLDVLVVAVLIVTVKLGAVVSVEVHGGLYVFGASVFLTMYLTHQAAKSHLLDKDSAS